MVRRKPIIGISSNLVIDESGRFKDFWRTYVNEDYVTAILKAGGIPFIIPIVDDKEVIRAQVENIDAIIFSGGEADINPAIYGEEISERSTAPNNKRDWFDFELAKIVKEFKKPTLTVCRGHQVANILRGGTLHQDTSYANNMHLTHNQQSTPDFLAHEIKIDKDSLLYDILKKEEIWVNSFHHQVVKDVPEMLKVTAVATDGAIEAVEYKDPEYFFLSVQWHPEMMAARDNEDMLKIFKRLIKEVKE